jgi:uncharacterized protein (TIGR02453 family)
VTKALPTPATAGAGRSPRFGPDALAFLRSLARNNRREWFQARKDRYDEVVRGPMVAFVDRLAEDLAQWAPDLVATPRVSIFRIYRDTRFSHDKTPYKTNIAAHFPHRDLPKGECAGLYVEVAPRHVWYGGGMYLPTPRQLAVVRQHLATHHRQFEKLLRAPAFQRTFGQLDGETLQRVPRGYPADHPAARWLRHRQFLAGVEQPAEFATSPAFYKTVSSAFRALAPVIAFLNAPQVAATKIAAAARPWVETGR